MQPEVVEYPEPFTTIFAVAFLALIIIYLAGGPATLAVTAMLWRQRTRRHAAPAPPSSGRQATAPATPAPAPWPVSAGATSGLMHLQRLERETLAAPGQQPPADPARLLGEIDDLIARHGARSMVGGYASGLRVIVLALAPVDATDLLAANPPDPPRAVSDEVPDELRAGLGRIAAVGRPIPAGWAFSWYGHRAGRWPAEADQRRGELAAAFARRYQTTYPHGGMILALTGAKLTLRYTPASARYGGRPVDVPTGLPDVFGHPDALRRLRAVADAAVRELGLPPTR